MSYKDTIEHLVRERAHDIGELSWRQKMGRKRSTAIIASVLEAFGFVGFIFAIACAIAYWYQYNPPAPDWFFWYQRGEP